MLTLPETRSPLDTEMMSYADLNLEPVVLVPVELGYEGLRVNKLLRLLGIKPKPQPPTNQLSREAIVDMKLQAVKDELQSLRGELNDRIDQVSEAIDEVRSSA